MPKRVYLETTVVSYLTARPSRDVIVAGHQQATHEWWELRRPLFDLYVSQFVLDEAGAGDPGAADLRLGRLQGLPLLETTDSAVALVNDLLTAEILPRRAVIDAFHVALSTIHGMDILLTWNCRHLANAELLGSLAGFLRNQGYDPPIICTPDGLMGE